MDSQIQLIERVRRTLPTGSNYAVAKALETSQTDLTRVLQGKHGLALKSIVRVSEILQIDLKDVLVLCQEAVAKRPADKEFWGRRSPRITASIATAILAFALAVISKDASSQSLSIYTANVDRSIHYAKFDDNYILDKSTGSLSIGRSVC